MEAVLSHTAVYFSTSRTFSWPAGVKPDTPLPLPCCQHPCCAFLWHCVLSTVQCAVCSETVAFLCLSRTCNSLVCILSLADVCAPLSLFYCGCSDVDKSVFAVAILLLWLLEDHVVLRFFFWSSWHAMLWLILSWCSLWGFNCVLESSVGVIMVKVILCVCV